MATINPNNKGAKMGVVQIKNMLEDLKLTGMIKVFDILKTRATKESWTSEESLDFLLQAELQYREQAANDRRIKNSKLPEYFKLEDFDFISPDCNFLVQLFLHHELIRGSPVKAFHWPTVDLEFNLFQVPIREPTDVSFLG